MSGQLPFGLEPGSIKPGAIRSMTSDKLASFSLGGTKKTAFQKRKEELAAKRKEQEDALAAEQARFIEEFEGGPDKPKKFVRADETSGESSDRDRPPPRPTAGPRISAPPRRGSAAVSRGPPAASTTAFGGLEDDDADVDGETIDGLPVTEEAPPAGRPSALVKKGKDKGPSQMEQFMMELRREQVGN
jgi:hypothetical protein